MEKTLSVIPATDSLSCRRHTFKYVEITPPGGLAPVDSLQFSFTDRDGGMWNKQLILYNSPSDFEVRDIIESQHLLSVSRSFRKAVLVLANSAPDAGIYRMVFSIQRGAYQKPVPLAFALDQNYPNPFNRETVIGFSVPERSHVRIRIVNLQGQTVKTLVDEMRDKGAQLAVWDAAGLSSGVYVAVLESGNTRLTRKMTFLK
ncbi:MAG: T9SS type A sorting domain-containing protein [Candidatus Latescibacterota bacterium]